ncbi:protein translocase subunit SecD [Patescibacteria group bacterium]|nr:protein translocase subunit SecD [Patescibacteria group bacterium]
MNKPRKLFAAILLLTVISAVIDLPREIPLKFSIGPLAMNTTLRRPSLNLKIGPLSLKRDLEVRQGLDLKGGSHLVFEADMRGIEEADREDSIKGAKEVIARRVDLYGVSEPLIQTSKTEDTYRIIVELPGVKNTQEAIELIGQTAQLDFRQEPTQLEEDEATDSAQQQISILDYQPTGLSGRDLAKAQVQFAQTQTGQPVVALVFTDEGKEKFGEITTRNVGKRVAIFLDEMLLTAPVVQQAITSGEAVISGDFTLEEAKNLAIQLNAGALPVPIKVVEERTVGATLGQDSVHKSLQAGVIGLSLVMLFMVANYGWLGVIADLALIVYGLLTLTIYKLIPVTVSLPGLAGFILSVGMAVDANILIFERMKEEERSGKPWRTAMELGFGRAWDSIKDANVATLMTAFVLLNPFEWAFLPTSGMARGFALTLGIGVLIGLFTGVIVTRTFLRVLYARKEKNQ